MQRNRLAAETSPYLLQHADNPVDWYPWGEPALDAARRDNKPILLSIGYSACHWCHVMAHESFEDPATAALMNQLFINIKVDREERPDLDKIYQIGAAADHSGLRRLAADHVPDAGRTDALFRRHLFSEGAALWHARVPRSAAAGGRVLSRSRRGDRPAKRAAEARVRRRCAPAPAAAGVTLDASPLREARAALGRSFDAQFRRLQPGAQISASRPASSAACGIGIAPRPTTSPDLQALYMASLTLTRMAEGGIYDQLGGGFSRYSVDGQWMIPHFEKMLYDNGQLLCEYARAALATGEAAVRAHRR